MCPSLSNKRIRHETIEQHDSAHLWNLAFTFEHQVSTSKGLAIVRRCWIHLDPSTFNTPCPYVNLSSQPRSVSSSCAFDVRMCWHLEKKERHRMEHCLLLVSQRKNKNNNKFIHMPLFTIKDGGLRQNVLQKSGRLPEAFFLRTLFLLSFLHRTLQSGPIVRSISGYDGSLFSLVAGNRYLQT